MKERQVYSMQFEFYVLNFNINKQQAEMFNIFRNHRVNEAVEAEVKKYIKLGNKYTCPFTAEDNKTLTGFNALVYEVDNIIMWQEWSRCEYEISVGSLFDETGQTFEKWDCYRQAHANKEAIARECLYQYKQHHKIK